MSTDISFEYGETALGIQFPLITLCQTNIYIENPIINECNDGSWDYDSIFVSCMKGNQTFKVTIAMEVSIDGGRTRCHFLYQKLKEILTRYSRTILEASKDWLISKI